ncbi:hypothetical protein DFH11DRAFT_1601249 [Phellopilus nigrolimitatus]|nr:hypothetical protein DFH11DRAFT_1601249 [Phellopilus nigrolimitatus]
MSTAELVRELHVPESFKTKTVDDKKVEEWNKSARQILKDLKVNGPLNAQILASVAELEGHEEWLATETYQLARDILFSAHPDIEAVKVVLESHVKPLFLSNPHPQLNLATGRTLPRTAGGPMASQDYYDEQTWKKHPGVANVVSWCIRQIPAESYEQVWHLLIPPVMTFLDDYQAPYKLRGVTLVSELLKSVPASLLKRTGIGHLLMTSLNRVIMNLHDPTSPRLIRLTVPVTLRLIDLTTVPDSTERFDQLCQLLGENIIGGAWMYAPHEQETIEASLDVLPLIVGSLGIGAARYMKALIPQCIHCVTPNELRPSPHSLNVAALRALLSIIRECQPRIYRWKGEIIEGVGKYWVSICDAEEKKGDNKLEQGLVKEIFESLSKTCPTVLDNEYARLLQTEPSALRVVLVS